MKHVYHLCLSSHDEVMFRDEEDFIRGFNCIALAALKTESLIIADAEMPTHVHIVVRSEHIDEMSFMARYSYSRYFNSKYHRKGRLGEKYWFCTEIEGVRRISTAVSYVMRQGLHHGLVSTPFEYPYCSINVVFQKELGKESNWNCRKNKSRYLFLPRGVDNLPLKLRMSSSGQLLREDILDVRYVEDLYVTPRNFLYYMNRCTDERWMSEQSEEKSATGPVSLETIEKGVEKWSVNEMLANEKGRVDQGKMSDPELCRLIDNQYVPSLFKKRCVSTLYEIPIQERRSLAKVIFEEYGSPKYHRQLGSGGLCTQNKRVSGAQLARCLALGYRSPE